MFVLFPEAKPGFTPKADDKGKTDGKDKLPDCDEDKPHGSSTAFILIGVVLVLAPGVGGGPWCKMKQSIYRECSEADCIELCKGRIASVSACGAPQKVAFIKSDVFKQSR